MKTTTFIVESMSGEDAQWHQVPEGCVRIKLDNGTGYHPGWFPIELVSGVDNNIFNGVIPGRSVKEVFKGRNMGSQSIATTNPAAVIDILVRNGYSLIKY